MENFEQDKTLMETMKVFREKTWGGTSDFHVLPHEAGEETSFSVGYASQAWKEELVYSASSYSLTNFPIPAEEIVDRYWANDGKADGTCARDTNEKTCQVKWQPGMIAIQKGSKGVTVHLCQPYNPYELVKILTEAIWRDALYGLYVVLPGAIAERMVSILVRSGEDKEKFHYHSSPPPPSSTRTGPIVSTK